jgi:cytoskeletal protein RodZ
MGGPLTPGTLLREARERRGMSVRELAAVTRIAPKSIEALEADDYERLPAEVFVRGFLKNCARELEMDAHELLGLYFLRTGIEPSRGVVEADPKDEIDEHTSVESLFAASRMPRLSYVAAVLAIILGLGLSLLIFGQPATEQLSGGPAPTTAPLDDTRP